MLLWYNYLLALKSMISFSIEMLKWLQVHPMNILYLGIWN